MTINGITIRAFETNTFTEYGFRFIVEMNGEIVKTGRKMWYCEDAAIEAGMNWASNNVAV
jgi:D-lyxose ketol-isomerase